MAAIRGFNHYKEAFYGNMPLPKDSLDEINFGMYCEDGGTEGEMSITWVNLGGKGAAQLRSFDDSWNVLATFTDVIAAMKDREGIQPEEFCHLLLRLGFKDMTQRKGPKANVKTCPTCKQEVR